MLQSVKVPNLLRNETGQSLRPQERAKSQPANWRHEIDRSIQKHCGAMNSAKLT